MSQVTNRTIDIQFVNLGQREIDASISSADITAELAIAGASTYETQVVIGQMFKGDKGDKGDAATIRVGTVNPGLIAQVQNVGTETDAVFNFTLPKGDKGNPGERGPAGPQGIPGDDGYTPVKGQDYFTAEDIGEIEAYVVNELIDSITVTEEIWAKSTDEAIKYMNEHHTWVSGVVYYTVEEDDTESESQQENQS